MALFRIVSEIFSFENIVT